MLGISEHKFLGLIENDKKGKTLCITVRINAFYNQFHR